MAYPRTPGGLFPLTTAPTSRNAGGQYPLSAVLSDAIRSLAPTAYWKMDEASGNLADAMSGGYTATVTGSPTYVAAVSPIGRGVTFSGTGQYGTISAAFPDPSASIGIGAVIKHSAASGTIASRWTSGAGSWVFDAPSGLLRFIGKSAAGANAVVAGSDVNTVNDGAWHFVFGQFDSASTRWHLAVDAVIKTNTSAGAWGKTAAGSMLIGASDYSSPNTLFNGSIAHLFVLNDRLLTTADMSWLYSIAKGA